MSIFDVYHEQIKELIVDYRQTDAHRLLTKIMEKDNVRKIPGYFAFCKYLNRTGLSKKRLRANL